MSHGRTRRTELGDHFTEGARLLWDAMERLGFEQYQLEKHIQAPTGLVSRLLYGDQRAGRVWMFKLYNKLGIPLESWNQTSSKPFLPPAARPLVA